MLEDIGHGQQERRAKIDSHEKAHERWAPGFKKFRGRAEAFFTDKAEEIKKKQQRQADEGNIGGTAQPLGVELLSKVTHEQTEAEVSREAPCKEFQEDKKVFLGAAFLRAEDNAHEREAIREAECSYRESGQ